MCPLCFNKQTCSLSQCPAWLKTIPYVAYDIRLVVFVILAYARLGDLLIQTLV